MYSCRRRRRRRCALSISKTQSHYMHLDVIAYFGGYQQQQQKKKTMLGPMYTRSMLMLVLFKITIGPFLKIHSYVRRSGEKKKRKKESILKNISSSDSLNDLKLQAIRFTFERIPTKSMDQSMF